MRILQVIASLDQSQGGPPRTVVGLGKALASRGLHIGILARGAAGWQEEELQPPANSEGSLSLYLRPSARQLFAEGCQLLSKYDMIHFHGMWHPVGGLLQLRCQAQGRPYIISPHGELDVWPMQQKWLKKRLHLALVGRRLVRRAAALHLLNEEELAGVRCLKLQGRYFIVPNGIDPQEWAHCPPRGYFRAKWGVPPDALLILFLARLHYKKAPDVLLEAFADLAGDFPEAHLILAGPDGGMQRQLEAMIAQRGLGGRVQLPGLISGEERKGAYVDADIFALPSRQEGHPFSVIEAAYMGKALLITPHCHCPELPAGRAAEVVEVTVEAVREGLRRLLTDSAYRERLRQEAQRIARIRYPWANIAVDFERQYQLALNHPEQLGIL